MTRKIGGPGNRQNAPNPPLLSSALFAYTLEHVCVVISRRRIGLVDMDLDEGRVNVGIVVSGRE